MWGKSTCYGVAIYMAIRLIKWLVSLLQPHSTSLHIYILFPDTAQTVITRELPPTYSIHLDSLDTLSCEALGDSTAELTFYWTKDGVLLEISGNLEYENPGASGSLRINSTGMSDAGVYMCLVNTTVGTLSAPTVLSSPSRVVITGEAIISSVLCSCDSSTVCLHEFEYPVCAEGEYLGIMCGGKSAG